MTAARRNRIDQIAADIGRLQYRYPGDHIISRMADHVETLAVMLEPCAAELANTIAPGDETAITEAIRIVEARRSQLRHLLRCAT